MTICMSQFFDYYWNSDYTLIYHPGQIFKISEKVHFSWCVCQENAGKPMNYVQSNVSDADLSFPHSFVSFMSINYDFGDLKKFLWYFPNVLWGKFPKYTITELEPWENPSVLLTHILHWIWYNVCVLMQ